MKITIIGAGNMGGAIARGLAKGTLVEEKQITVTAHTQKTLDAIHASNPQIHVTLDNVQAVKDADLVVLAVKPWVVGPVIEQLRQHLDLSKQVIVSVVAAVSFDDLRQMLKAEKAALFRVIPNTAISVGESLTAVAASGATDEQVQLVLSIFNEMGTAVLIEERLMGAATALCSCGIAYALRFVKASVDGAVELGLYPAQAKTMAAQTLLGAATLLMANDSMPDDEIYKVTTPGGLTIRGLNAMEANGFSAAVMAGLRASMK